MRIVNREFTHNAMVRKLFLLLVIAAVVWFGARALVHRGEVKATVVFDRAGALRKGDPVIAEGVPVGVVTKITHLDGSDAVSIRIDRQHRRDIVSDSLFAIDKRRIVVTNTFALGSPIADGDVLRARTDGVRSWLTRHAAAVQPLVARVKRAADDEIEKLDEKHIDEELAELKAKVPDWKAEGADVLDHRLGALKARIARIEDDLRRSNRTEEARKLKEKFEKWLDEVQR
ncbi:MAG TPA: MlaD family protein [Thermoanaerobaculia bacterium]|nr:MlaD family protein [Thermoanaerobaculia bacterium]